MACSDLMTSGTVDFVLDCGSFQTKLGRTHVAPTPEHVFRTVVGRDKEDDYFGVISRFSTKYKKKGRDYAVGDVVTRLKGLFDATHPKTQRQVVDWENMAHIYEYCNEATADNFKGNRVVLCDSQLSAGHRPAESGSRLKRRELEVMFEEFECESVAFVPEFQCTLATFGRSEGVVVSAGHSKVRVSAVGCESLIASQLSAVSTLSVSDSLWRDSVFVSFASLSRQFHETVKEKNCYCVADYSARRQFWEQWQCGEMSAPPRVRECQRVLQQWARLFQVPKELEPILADYSSDDVYAECQLPDGETIGIAPFDWSATRCLFQNQTEDGTIPDAVESVLRHCEDRSDRQRLLANVVIEGGLCNLPGFATALHRYVGHKLENESDRAQLRIHSRCDAFDDMSLCVWNGARVLADSRELLKEFVVTRQSYRQ